MSKQLTVPDIGDFHDAAVIEVLVAQGDTVEAGQSLIVLETDKATMDVPASEAGVICELMVSVGSTVSQGTPIATLEAVTEAGSEQVARVPDTQSAAATIEPASSRVAAIEHSRIGGKNDSDIPTPDSAPTPTPSLSVHVPRQLTVPDIGDYQDVAVIEVLVGPGDVVEARQGLIVLETDKATMDVPATESGAILELLVAVGSTVNQGDAIATLAPTTERTAETANAPKLGSSEAAQPRNAVIAHQDDGAPEPPDSPVDHLAKASTGGLPHAAPSVRKLARELGVPIGEVTATGAKGRITAEDVRGFVGRVMQERSQTRSPKVPSGSILHGLPQVPKVDFAKFGPIERRNLSRIRRISGLNLHRNWVTIPHVTNHEEADITELEDFRVRVNQESLSDGVKLTLLALLIKACVSALKIFPEFNASLDDEQIVLKHYYHIGFAADTPNGLVVPVIRDADQKGIIEIASQAATLAAKAREGKLAPTDMSGGTFSISSLGGIGGTYFTPIINAPEVAILGVGKSRTRLEWIRENAVPRLILPLSLSWDHRVVDGAAAGRFNAHLAAVLGDFRRVLL